MAYVSTKNKFHVALNGVGLLLQGAPERPAYVQDQAPTYGNRFAQGDRDYNDLSFWWYLTQTDWSGGFKDTLSFLDDAKYYYSTNIDAYSQVGAIKLERAIVQERDNSANGQVFGVKPVTYNGSTLILYLDEDDSRNLASGSVVASTGTGDVNFHIGHKNYLWQLYSSAGSGQVHNYDGTTDSDKSSQINTIIDGSIGGAFTAVSSGDVLYIFGITTTDKIFCVKTSVANPAASGDWTLLFEVSIGGSSGEVCGADILGNEIIFLVEGGVGTNTFSLWTMNVSTGTPSKLRDFSGDQLGLYGYDARYVKTFNDVALITVISDNDNGKGEIYSYNGQTLSRIYSTDPKKYSLGNQASGRLTGGCVVAGNRAYWGNLVYDGESFYNFIKTVDDDATYPVYPVGYDPAANKLYLVDTETVSTNANSIIYSYDLDGTTYKDGASGNAFIVLSQHDKIQSIDKLLNTITIGFENLAAGQSIEVYYMVNPTPSVTLGDWTSLGTVSHTVDGASVGTKTFNFPDAIVGKKVWFRINLKSTISGTPVLTDFTLEYLPTPSSSKVWQLRINTGDEVRRLDGRLVETTARELKSLLERAWWTKSALDYQDLDYCSTQINDGDGITTTDTTITVDSTLDFPEQGRIKIDNEEIFYTGKTPTTFTGCTRGVRDTQAATHADNAVVNNAYKVLITDLRLTTPVLLEDKELEYIAEVVLRET